MLFNQGGLVQHGVCPSCGYCPTCGHRRQNGIQGAWGGLRKQANGGLQYQQGWNPQYDAAQRKYEEMLRSNPHNPLAGQPVQEKPDNA